MDPLTTLAAAATGPNTLQSQALTALRSAGPQESFSTRVGNPHPLQVQQLAQPTTPQLNPIMAQQASAPTATQQHFPMPIMPLTSPMADPAPTALHIPTLQAIHRMQQQNSPAPAVMPMLPQTPVTQPQATLPRPNAVHPGQLPVTHLEAAGRFGTAGDAGPASAAQQRAQYPAARPSDSGKWVSSEHGIGPHTAHQHHLTPFGGRSHSWDFDQSHTQHHEGKERRAVCPRRIAAEADVAADPEATAKINDPATTERAEPTGADPGPLGPDPQAAQAGIKRLSSAADLNWASYQSKTSALLRRRGASGATEPPTQYAGPREGFSQSSQPQMEARMPSVQLDLTQEAATTQQQPLTRFRPSNYTVDLSNTTNPPPPQVMVKPAVMLRCDERPQPVSFTVTEAAQLSRTLLEMGSGSGIPESTYSELAAILLSSGRRDQAIDISSEVMSVAEGVHQVFFIPWNGKERATFGTEEGESGSHYEHTWAHGTSPSGLLGVLSEDLVRAIAQDLKIEGTEQQATAVYGSATPGSMVELLPTDRACSSNQTSQSLQPRDGCMRDNPVQAPALQMRLQGEALGACHRCQKGVVRTPERWGFHAGHLTIKGIAIFAP